MNKSVVLLFLTTFSSLFGDDNIQVRLENGQKTQGEFIGTYMNHVHILVGEKIYYYACDDIVSISYSSEGLGSGKGFDYDCSINTVTADILFPPELDPMTGEMAQMLPDVFNPDIPKPAVEKGPHRGKGERVDRGEHFAGIAEVLGLEVEDLRSQLAQGATMAEVAGDSVDVLVAALVDDAIEKINDAAAADKITQEEVRGVSTAEDFVVIDGVKYARVSPNKEAAQAEPKAGVRIPALKPKRTLFGTRWERATYNDAESAPKFNACYQARLDAVEFTSPLWYAGGIIYYVGVPAYYLSKPQPNHYAISNIAPEEQLLYLECYKTAAKNEQGRRMALGCGGMFLFLIMTAGM